MLESSFAFSRTSFLTAALEETCFGLCHYRPGRARHGVPWHERIGSDHDHRVDLGFGHKDYIWATYLSQNRLYASDQVKRIGAVYMEIEVSG